MTEQDPSKPSADTEAAQTATVEGDPIEAGTPETTVQPRRRASGVARLGLVLALFAWLALLGAGGAGGWYLWQDYQARPERQARLAAIESALAEKPGREDLARVARQPRQDLDRLRQELDQLQQGVGDLRGQVSGHDQRLGRLQDRVNRNQRGWTLAETAYLLRMASYRLQLAHDRNSAVAALDAADQALLRLGEVDLLPVREAIAAEIAKLRRLPKPDPEGVALALGELQKEIGGLPLKGQAEGTAPAAEPAPADGSWRTVLERFVVVSRSAGPGSDKPRPERFEGVRRKLHTALEMARLSAVRLDLDLFQDSLDRAEVLVEQGFASDAGATREYLERLAAQRARLNVGEPARIGEARRLLEDFLAADRASIQGNQ